MTEENKTEEVVAKKPENTYEERALEMGWRPREEFHGEDDDFIDAKEYVRRKPLFDKIESVNRALSGTQQTIKALAEHNAKIEKAAYERAVKTLRDEQIVARKEGDLERYDELQEQIDETRQEAEKVRPVQQAAQPPQEVTDWIGRNQWYAQDSRMRAAADAAGLEAAQRGLTGQAVLNYIEKDIKETFPHKFKNPNRDRPAATEGSGGGRSGGGRERGSDYRLTEQEENIMKTLTKTIPGMTKEKYIQQLKQAKGEE